MSRRFALVAAGLEREDPVTGYKIDVFTQSIPEGIARATVETYVRMAMRIADMGESQFFMECSDVYDALPFLPEGESSAGDEVFRLHHRHSAEVFEALRLKTNEHYEALAKGRIAAGALLSLVGSGKLSEPLIHSYARYLGNLLARSIRIHFSARRPKNEREIQEVGQTVLAAAEERLYREYPTLAFGIIGTTPDFSTVDSRLFLEFKHVKNRRDLNRVNTEITSRILVYREQGASVLFVVFDDLRVIGDVAAFCQQYEKHPGIQVMVV